MFCSWRICMISCKFLDADNCRLRSQILPFSCKQRSLKIRSSRLFYIWCKFNQVSGLQHKHGKNCKCCPISCCIWTVFALALYLYCICFCIGGRALYILWEGTSGCLFWSLLWARAASRLHNRAIATSTRQWHQPQERPPGAGWLSGLSMELPEYDHDMRKIATSTRQWHQLQERPPGAGWLYRLILNFQNMIIDHDNLRI